MELRTYFKILIRRWWLVAAPLVLVAAYLVATYAPPGNAYQVVMRFSTGTRPAGLSEDYDRFYAWRSSEYIAGGLADLVETGVFAEAVASRAAQKGHEIPAAAIRGAIVSDYTRSILVVYLYWHDSEQIVAIADAIVAEIEQNSAAYFPQIQGLEPAARLLDPLPVPEALAPLAPGLRDQLMGPAIKLGLAGALGLALAFLWHYLDPTLHETDELEALGVEVLASIPRR